MRQMIKNMPILGKWFIFLYETFFLALYWIKRTPKDIIIKSRYRKIRKDLKNVFSDSDNMEIQELLQNIERKGHVETFNYPFTKKYNAEDIPVYTDEKNGYRYVKHAVGPNEYERIYFPLNWIEGYIQSVYNNLLVEQDKESPHYYFHPDYPVPEDAIVLDCGAAEGIFGINVVKHAKHVYLFEGLEEWKIPLQLTFAKWQDKVDIVPKYISDVSEGDYISLDSFFEKVDTAGEKVFIKMDIEGYEEKALEGFQGKLKEIPDITLAICSYHKQESENNIKSFFLKEGNYRGETSKGYMIINNNIYEKPVFPYIRKGITFIKKLGK